MAIDEQMEGFHEPFGPHQDDVWDQLIDAVNSTHTDPDAAWNGERIVAKAGPWTVTLDTELRRYAAEEDATTRVRAPYLTRDGFRFAIHRAGMLSRLETLLGLQDITVGDEAFDEAFVVKGSDADKVRAFFAEEGIRQALLDSDVSTMCIKDDEGWFGDEFPDGVDELYVETGSPVSDREQIERLYELFGRCLHRLCELGSAVELDPKVDLS